MIYVTKPFLPPIEEYQEYVTKIWDKHWLTNNGPLVLEFESKLKEYLALDHSLFVSNGTIALQLAIKALGIEGEVITTPFSYVATSSSIVWEGCTPVFVDIDENTFNIDPRLIEGAITEKTTAIIATHVYGNACDIEAIGDIAKKHKLKLIYDAAHCFGTKYKGKSILNYGDISTISFHATKLFHTIEGGTVVCQDENVAKKVGYLRNFGHDGLDKFNGVGINGKNSEFHAAMGLVNLTHASNILEKRKASCYYYDDLLQSLNLQKPLISDDLTYNYAYYPVVFSTEEECLLVYKTLKNHDVFARRYFYPILSELDYVEKVDMPVAESIAKRIICLPLFEQILDSEIEFICDIILKTLKN